MNFFFGNAFWGTLLILWGISLILKSFGIHLPLARTFFAVIIILFGLKLLLGTSSKLVHRRDDGGKKTVLRVNRSGDYTMVFSSGYVDLKDIDQNAPDMNITVVFGSAIVVLPAHLSYNIEPTTIFGKTILPERNQTGFGTRTYIHGENQRDAINIDSNCIFGTIEYVFEDVQASKPDNIDETVIDGGNF